MPLMAAIRSVASASLGPPVLVELTCSAVDRCSCGELYGSGRMYMTQWLVQIWCDREVGIAQESGLTLVSAAHETQHHET